MSLSNIISNFFFVWEKKSISSPFNIYHTEGKKKPKDTCGGKDWICWREKKFLLNDKILLNPPKLKHIANLFEWWKKDYIFLENDKKKPTQKQTNVWLLNFIFFLFWNNLLSDIFFIKNRDKRKNKVCCFRRPNSQLTNHDFLKKKSSTSQSFYSLDNLASSFFSIICCC